MPHILILPQGGIPIPSVSILSNESQEGRHGSFSVESPDVDDQETGTVGNIVKSLLPPI